MKRGTLSSNLRLRPPLCAFSKQRVQPRSRPTAGGQSARTAAGSHTSSRSTQLRAAVKQSVLHGVCHEELGGAALLGVPSAPRAARDTERRVSYGRRRRHARSHDTHPHRPRMDWCGRRNTRARSVKARVNLMSTAHPLGRRHGAGAVRGDEHAQLFFDPEPCALVLCLCVRTWVRGAARSI